LRIAAIGWHDKSTVNCDYLWHIHIVIKVLWWGSALYFSCGNGFDFADLVQFVADCDQGLLRIINKVSSCDGDQSSSSNAACAW